MSQFCAKSLVSLTLLSCCCARTATSLTLRRPGGDAFELQPWELEQDKRRRHEACGAKILNAQDPDFPQQWQRNLHQPLMILNLVGDWAALKKWTPTWFREKVVEELDPQGITPWNFTDPIKPQCVDCDWTALWGVSFDHKVYRYFDEWNEISDGAASVEDIVDLKKPNAVVFDPTYRCEDIKDAPTPGVFGPFCNNRHVAFAAYGTSHGLHRHLAAWQAQVVGLKSWWLLPSEVYTSPKDVTTAKSPFGFPHEPIVQHVNSLCGYKPTLPEVNQRIINCVQGPGETMYVPNNWWHGTCALDNFTIGTGGGLNTKERAFRREVVFVNDVPTAVAVLFVDGEEERDIGSVESQANNTFSTYAGHSFRFRQVSDGQYVGRRFSVPLAGPHEAYVHHIRPTHKAEL